MAWHNLRIRGDLYRIVERQAKAEHRSVASMADVLLTRALESVLGTSPLEGDHAGSGSNTRPPSPAPSRAPVEETGGEPGRTDGVSQRPAPRARKVPSGPQASPPSDVSSSASQGREGEAGVNGGAGAAPDQTDVFEMLASCPNCATTLERGEMLDGEHRWGCPHCGYVREPS